MPETVKTMKIRPIGVIHSPFKKREGMPIQPFRSDKIGRVEVFEKYAAGLKDILGFSHIILIYRFHKSRGYKLLVKPFLDDKKHGLFATRAPFRPNQIGMSVVRLLRQKKNVLFVKGIDALDGTPLLDIKPYVPQFSADKKVRIGWLKSKLKTVSR
jgi:tRNA-Thr(GGU) m(6)t(6)A37 methyltransferase TsaA